MRTTCQNLTLVVALGLTCGPVFAAGLVTGWGGAPVSQTMTSLYLSGHDGVDVKPLVVVYFHGRPGWHHRQWRNEFQQNQSPGGVTLFGEGLELEVEANIDDGTVTVQGQSFARRENNVFVVLASDQPAEAQRVVPLGRYELKGDGKHPLPVALRASDPALAKRLAAETAEN